MRRENGKNKTTFKGGVQMDFILILLVMLAFLTAIFTAGYNDRPGKN
jgi:hypothetical protein